MSKLPQVSGKEAVKVFQNIGYQVTRQRGSLVRMHHSYDSAKIPLTIPLHRTLAKGLLQRLLRDSELTLEEFIKLLRR